MKIKLAVAVLAAFLLLAGSAQAIEGPRAVRHIRRYVKQDCHSISGFKCVGWQVYHCYKLGSLKVRCYSLEEFEHNGNWRICRFNTAAVERRDQSWVSLHFGTTRCYAENGEQIY